MLKMSLKIRYLAFVAALCCMSPVFAENSENQDSNEISLDDLNNFISRDPPEDAKKLEKLQDAAGFLKETINNPIWNETKAPIGRDILYHLPHKITALEYGGLAVNLFFNMTDDMVIGGSNVSKDAFNEDNFGTLIEVLSDTKMQNSGELSALIPLFKKVSIQERRAGGLILFGMTKGPFVAQLQTSLQFAERNFWLSNNDQDSIKDLLLEKFPNSNFDKNELIRSRYGMGDTRFKLGFNTINMTHFQTDFGVETILPTSKFSGCSRIKTTTEGLVSNFQAQNYESLKEEGTNLLRGIRDYLIDPKLGNDGHFGIGCYLENKIGIFHNLAQIWLRASFDKLLPNEEDRLLMFQRTINPKDVTTSTLDEPHASQFISNFVKQFVLPTSFKVTTYPGGIFNFVAAVSTDIKKIRIAAGYDFYTQQKEYIKKIHNTAVDLRDLRIIDAEYPRTIQHKIFSEIMYVKRKPRMDWGVGLGGDKTISNTGIGADWTAYLKFVASF